MAYQIQQEWDQLIRIEARCMGELASIVIVTWNRLDYTRLCLESILQNTEYEPVELIVVDNGSQDGIICYLQRLKARGLIDKLVLNDQNKGVGYALNQGFKRAKGHYLIRSDNDMLYYSGWLQALISALNKLTPALIQIAVVYQIYEDKEPPVFFQNSPLNGIPFQKLPVIGGCNMAFTRETFEEIGPFAEVIAAEDVLFCQRARGAGLLVGQIGNGVGTHLDHPKCPYSLRYSKYKNYRRQRIKELLKHGYNVIEFSEDNKLL